MLLTNGDISAINHEGQSKAIGLENSAAAKIKRG